MIWFYDDELERIALLFGCTDRGARLIEVCNKHKQSNKYIRFHVITNLGVEYMQLDYGRNRLSRGAIHYNVSYLGIQERT